MLDLIEYETVAYFILSAIIVLVLANFIIVFENERVVVERFGRFEKVLEPGIHLMSLCTFKRVEWKFPDSENPHEFCGHKIIVNEQTYDPQGYTLRCKDGSDVQVDLVVSFQIFNVKQAVYHTDNLYRYFANELESYMIGLVGDMAMGEITVKSLTDGINLECINDKLKLSGICITRILVQNIDIPGAIAEDLTEIKRKEISKNAEIAALAQEERQLEAQCIVNRKRAMASNMEAETKHAAELRMERETWMAKKAMILEQQQLELDFQKRRAELFSQYPASAEFALAKINADAFSKIASGDNTRLVIAPEAALNALGSFRLSKTPLL